MPDFKNIIRYGQSVIKINIALSISRANFIEKIFTSDYTLTLTTEFLFMEYAHIRLIVPRYTLHLNIALHQSGILLFRLLWLLLFFGLTVTMPAIIIIVLCFSGQSTLLKTRQRHCWQVSPINVRGIIC